ncbi:MAG TPA: phosphatase PAP2 family protein, partial [Bryobacteraceae bacterium]|nr:phosphatase PAP2 family protein [Bryobacteraceae bacterium]
AFLYLLLSQMHGRPWVETARDWIPQALMIVAYKQMGWFAPATHANRLEHEWIVWDRWLLDDLHLRAIIELFGPVVPSLLELSYALVYAVPPITMGVIYALGLRKGADTILTIYLLGLFLCYGQFPFWPSEPPRTVFPGQDMPNVHTAFRAFNLWLVGNYGIHTSVFPSAHVSGAFAAAFGIAYLIPQRRRLVLSYFVYAILVAVATVYGRSQYAVDAVGGLIVAVFAWPLGSWLVAQAEARRRRTARLYCDGVRNAIPEGAVLCSSSGPAAVRRSD